MGGSAGIQIMARFGWIGSAERQRRVGGKTAPILLDVRINWARILASVGVLFSPFYTLN